MIRRAEIKTKCIRSVPAPYGFLLFFAAICSSNFESTDYGSKTRRTFVSCLAIGASTSANKWTNSSFAEKLHAGAPAAARVLKIAITLSTKLSLVVDCRVQPSSANVREALSAVPCGVRMPRKCQSNFLGKVPLKSSEHSALFSHETNARETCSVLSVNGCGALFTPPVDHLENAIPRGRRLLEVRAGTYWPDGHTRGHTGQSSLLFFC